MHMCICFIFAPPKCFILTLRQGCKIKYLGHNEVFVGRVVFLDFIIQLPLLRWWVSPKKLVIILINQKDRNFSAKLVERIIFSILKCGEFVLETKGENAKYESFALFWGAELEEKGGGQRQRRMCGPYQELPDSSCFGCDRDRDDDELDRKEKVARTQNWQQTFRILFF